MLNRDQLEAFASVAESGSFERAAARLNLTSGAVSQRMRALETHLKFILLKRTQPLRLTQAGEVLYRHLIAIRKLEDETYRHIDGRRDGTFSIASIAINADSLATWAGPLVERLVKEARVALEVVVLDRQHTVASLERGDISGSISTNEQAANGFKATPLGKLRYRCVASPELAPNFSNGLRVESIMKTPAVLYDREDVLLDKYFSNILGVVVTNYPRHYLPSPHSLADAIVNGLGYGLLPEVQAQAHFDSNALIDLTPDAFLDVPLYWHHWSGEAASAGSISDIVIDEARKRLLA